MNSLANLLKPFLLGFVLNFLKSKGPNQTFSFRIFRVLHTVQSLIFKVLCCSLSQTAHTFYHKLFCLSRTFFFFFKSFLRSQLKLYILRNHFFFLKIAVLRNENYITTAIPSRQALFSFFRNSFIAEFQ